MDAPDETALHHAIKKKDLEAVQHLIESGAQLSNHDEYGWTPLHYALKRNVPAALNLLLQHGAMIDATDHDGMTPLHWAISLGRFSSVRMLVEAGADLNIPDSEGLTSLHWAVKMGSMDAVRCLIKHGAFVDAKDKHDRTPVHWAIWNNALDALEHLLLAGANVNARNQDGRAAVHLALEAGKMPALNLLIRYGADLDVKDNEGSALIHVAVKLDSITSVQFLVENRVDVNAKDKHGMTAVAKAVEFGSLEPIEYLVDHGATVNVIDTRKTGRTPLHLACEKGSLFTSRHWIDIGADIHAVDWARDTPLHCAARGPDNLDLVKMLVERGAEVNVFNQEALTPLHLAVNAMHEAAVKYLISVDADVNLTFRDHNSPLKSAITAEEELRTRTFAQIGPSYYIIVRTLCEAGATWGEDCVAWMKQQDTTSELHSRSEWLHTLSESGDYRVGLAACAQHWIKQRSQNPRARLVDVPEETYRAGKRSVELYIASLQQTQSSSLVRRRKACIVGPSGEGKSSLIKSLVAMKSDLAQSDDRTIGVDLSRLDIHQRATATARELTTFEVTFWDFAGQDIYQVAHSLFFSKRTLYMLSIDLQVYSRAVQAAADEPDRVRDELLGRFVHHRVFRWARAILARQPDAELVIVGTKSDGLSERVIADLLEDLRSRLETWAATLLSELSGSTQSLVRKSLEEFQSRQPIVVNVKTAGAVAKARKAVNEALTRVPERSFLMPADYRAVLDVILDLRKDADGADEATRLSKLVIPLDRLVNKLQDEVDGIRNHTCRTILRTLHDLGDILWYERVGAGGTNSSSDVVILDPVILLDIVRDAINHTHEAAEDPAFQELTRDGVLRHSLLMSFPIWRALETHGSHIVLFFKQLLQFFNLAYPSNNQAMTADADLVVPSYWKLKKHQPQVDASMEVMQTSRLFSYAARWQYKVPIDVALCVYDQFIVQSASPRFVRSATAEAVLTSVPFQFDATFRLEAEDASSKKRDKTRLETIRIDVHAATESICWSAMKWFVCAMETVLEGYPGLAPITREIARVGRNNRLEIFSVDRVVTQLHGPNATPLRRLGRGLPFDLSWFIHKTWDHPEQLVDMERSEQDAQRERQRRILECLAEDPVKRSAPALWKIVVDTKALAVELMALSDLSGECCHAPFNVHVPLSFFSKYEQWLTVGTSLLSFLPRLTTTRMLEIVAQGPVNPLQDIHTIHYVESPFVLSRGGISNVTMTASDSVMAMLRALLERFDSMVDEEKLWELCNLERAVYHDRALSVWSHPSEVLPSIAV